MIPPKRGLPRCQNQVEKGPPKSLGRVVGNIVALKKLLGMLLQQKSLLDLKLRTGLGRKLGTGEKVLLKGSLGC